MAEQNSERLRDPERTREAILAAAEDLFARRGFEGTSLQQIGEAAGVARSTPAYFFGNKAALYDAVLARVIARAQETMARAYAKGDEAPSVEDAVESYVGAAIDFLSHDRNFVRLMQRERLAREVASRNSSVVSWRRGSLRSGRPLRRPASRQSASSSTSRRSAGTRLPTSTPFCRHWE